MPGNRYTSDSLTVLVKLVLRPTEMSSTVLPPTSAQSGRRRGRGHVLERLEKMLCEEIELREICGHRVQEQVLHPHLDPSLHAFLDLIDRAGEVDGFDVIPRTLVGHDREHLRLLLGDGAVVLRLLRQPGEVLVCDVAPLRVARRY